MLEGGVLGYDQAQQTQIKLLDRIEELKAVDPVYEHYADDRTIDSALWLARALKIQPGFFDDRENLLLQLALGEQLNMLADAELSDSVKQQRYRQIHDTQLLIATGPKRSFSEVTLGNTRYSQFDPRSNTLLAQERVLIDRVKQRGLAENRELAELLEERYHAGEFFADDLHMLGVAEPVACNFAVCSLRTLRLEYGHAFVVYNEEPPLVVIPKSSVHDYYLVRHEVTHLQTLGGGFLGGTGYIEGWTDLVSGEEDTYQEQVAIIYLIADALDVLFDDQDHLWMQIAANQDEELMETLRRRFLYTFGLEGYLLISMMRAHEKKKLIPGNGHEVTPSPLYVHQRLSELVGWESNL